jgi:hypothetical protein
MNVKRVTVFSSALLIIVALAVVPSRRVRAADPFPRTEAIQLVGFSAASSQPFTLRGSRGSPIVEGTLTFGVPQLGTVVSTIAAVPDLPNGAFCRAVFQQAVLTVLEGTAAPATLTLNFFGNVCLTGAPGGMGLSGAHYATGSLSLATTAPIGNGVNSAGWAALDAVFNENADGSAATTINGNLILTPTM